MTACQKFIHTDKDVDWQCVCGHWAEDHGVGPGQTGRPCDCCIIEETHQRTEMREYTAQLVAQFGYRHGNPDQDIIVEMRGEGEELTDEQVAEVCALWRTAQVTVSWPEAAQACGVAEDAS
jgi:hypothetical protein